MDIDVLNSLSDQLEGLRAATNIPRLQAPLNRDVEFERFLQHWKAGEPYDPVFEYANVDLAANLERIEEMRSHVDDDSPWAVALLRDLEGMRLTLDGLASRHPEAITAASVFIDGGIDEDSVRVASEILEQSPPPADQATRVEAADARDALRAGLQLLSLHDWTVHVEAAMSADMSVIGAERRVQVRQGTTFSIDAIRRLLVHEIGTHVLRSANGSAQPLRILGLGLAGYMATEEGLAAYNEERFGLTDAAVTRKYARRVLATERALSAGFGEVARTFPDDDPESVFAMMLRVKRGFVDTSAPGAHVKDKVYLEGLLRVRELAAESPSAIDQLMVGKVSIDQLPDVEVGIGFGWIQQPSISLNRATVDRLSSAALPRR